jgi:hypothetical protein
MHRPAPLPSGQASPALGWLSGCAADPRDHPIPSKDDALELHHALEPIYPRLGEGASELPQLGDAPMRLLIRLVRRGAPLGARAEAREGSIKVPRGERLEAAAHALDLLLRRRDASIPPAASKHEARCIGFHPPYPASTRRAGAADTTQSRS